MFRLNRRTFLRAAGLGGASYFLPSLARAQSSEAPLRFIMICTGLGPEISGMRMKPVDAPQSILTPSSYDPTYEALPDEASWDLSLTDYPQSEFSECLAPLYGVREDALIFDGLCFATAGLDPHGDAHAKGFLAAATGNPAAAAITDQKSMSGAPSLDRRIGRWLRDRDPSLTDLTSLNMRVSPYGYAGASTDGFHYFFFDRDANGVVTRSPVDQDPRAVFDRLFPNDESGSEVDPIRDRQGDVLNVVSDAYRRLDPRLSVADRQKLEQHRDLILDVQRRLEAQRDSTCGRPTRFEREQPRPSYDEVYQPTLDAFMDLIVASISCGVTRTVGLELPVPPIDRIGARPGEDYHHYYSHGTAPRKQFSPSGSADFELWNGAFQVQRNKTRHELEVVAGLAERLRAIPEGDGSVLDNTIILWANEISHGGHGHDQWPAVVLGGRNVLRTGRYIRYPRTNPVPIGITSDTWHVGQPHSQFLTTLCQAMGMEIEDLGPTEVEGEVREGPDRGLRRTLSLRGNLPGILV